VSEENKTNLASRLATADNKYLAEQRAFVRQIAIAAKSLDKDLRSLTQFNDNTKNEVMGFNDSELDKQQRKHTSFEASSEFFSIKESIEKMMR
jgi:hypothetical protein